MGCANFFMQMNPDMLASYRESDRAIIMGRPLWATIAFAFAVFGGTMGCLFLLLKKLLSLYLFIASFLGVLVAVGHSLSLGIEFQMGEIVGIILMPVVVAVFLIWYSIYVKNKGWVNT